MPKDRGWATHDEMCSLDAMASRKNAAELLHGYIKAAEIRADWAGLNKDAVIGHARQRLRAAERIAT